MSIPLSCADFTFPLLPHRAALEVIQRLGLQGVDLGLFNGRSHLRPLEIRGRETQAASELAPLVGDCGLEISDVFVQPGESHAHRAVNHPDAGERAQGQEFFLSALELAAEAGAKHITGLPGVLFEGESEEISFQRAVEGCAWRLDRAAEAGITYAVECHLGSIAPTPETVEKLLQACPGLTLTLDYGHFIFQGFSNEAVHPLLAHASHFHARCGAPDQLQTVLAENTIDFPAIVHALETRGYPGWLCLEYVWIDWKGCNRVDNLSESVQLRDFIRSSQSAKS